MLVLSSTSSSSESSYYTRYEPIGVYFTYESMRVSYVRVSFLKNFYWCLSGVSTNNRPNYLTLRIFFAFLTLFALNVSTIYTSQLINVFTRDIRGYQIDTIEEILDQELPIGKFFSCYNDEF